MLGSTGVVCALPILFVCLFLFVCCFFVFFFSSRRRHTRYWRDWSSDVCSSDLLPVSIPSLSYKARISKELKPWVGGGKLKRFAPNALVDSGTVLNDACLARSAAVSGLPAAARSEIGRASCRERV